jgi:oligosaccharide repeat unit polymerase
MYIANVDYWIVNLTGFAIALVLLVIIGMRTNDWLTFSHMFSVLWGANLLVSQLVLGGLLRVDISTLVILFAAWWMFLVSSICIIKKKPTGAVPIVDINRSTANAILFMLLVLQLFALAFEIRSIQDNPIMYFSDFFGSGLDLRLSGIYSTVEYPFSFSIWRWGQVLYIPLGIFMYFRKIISGRYIFLIFVIAFIVSISRHTRAPLIQLAVVSFVSWIVLYRPVAKIKVIVGGSIAILIMCIFIATQINLVEYDRYAQIDSAESIFAYIGSSPLSYESILKGNYIIDNRGYYSFEPINFLLFKMSIIDSYPGLTRAEAAIPFTTNVYTFLDTYTLDFGVLGALVGSFLTSVLVAWSYNRLIPSQNYASLAIYCYLVYCCVMALANNEFIRTNVLINIVLSLVIDFMIRIRPSSLTRNSSDM